mgnify:CR=1 FL=1
MAIVTTKTLKAAYVGLEVFNLKDYFDEVIGLDDVCQTKPSPEGIFKALKGLNKEKGITIIQVTHSHETAKYGNRIVKLKDGIVSN